MQTAEKSAIIICPFPNVRPINNLREGIRLGHYSDCLGVDADAELQPAQGEKNLYVVCFSRTIGKAEYPELLRRIRKQSCGDAPIYLLGLMSGWTEDRMPEELRDKDIIAAEPKESSVFIDPSGKNYFLFVHRYHTQHILPERILNHRVVDEEWYSLQAFLAEDLAH